MQAEEERIKEEVQKKREAQDKEREREREERQKGRVGAHHQARFCISHMSLPHQARFCISHTSLLQPVTTLGVALVQC